MNHPTKQFRHSRSERRMRPLFGFAAAAAAVATMGLAVIAPAQIAATDATLPAVVAAAPRIATGPETVAILPGHIHVVAVRTKATVRAASLSRADGGQRT